MMDLASPEDRRRFFAYTEIDPDTGCLYWRGAVDPGFGYGKVAVLRNGKRRRESAHRVSYELTYGELDPDAVVRHTCDHPECVQPAHLILGTHTDNVKDRVARSRSARGSEHGKAKLGDACVALMRHMARSGYMNPFAMSRLMGVDYKSVWNAIHGLTYKHLNDLHPTAHPTSDPLSDSN